MRDGRGRWPGRAGTGGSAAGRAAPADADRAVPACTCELRAACLTLATSPPSLLTATSMVAPLAGRPGEARMLRALSQELAERHGLEVSWRDDGSSFTVRFSRRPSAATEPTPGRGVVAALRGALGSAWTKGR